VGDALADQPRERRVGRRRARGLDVLARHDDLLRHLEAHAPRQLGRRGAGPALEDLRGCLGVHPHVRLRARCHVAALAVRAAHQREAAQQLRQPGLTLGGERHVRQRAGRDQEDLAGAARASSTISVAPSREDG
jgi:hypothetical protein